MKNKHITEILAPIMTSVLIFGTMIIVCGCFLNSTLSTQPSENSVFSRLFACVILKPYVFSLVFALTSRNKGKFFTLRRLPYPAALRKYALLPL